MTQIGLINADFFTTEVTEKSQRTLRIFVRALRLQSALPIKIENVEW